MSAIFDKSLVDALRERSVNSRVAPLHRAMLETAERDLSLDLEQWSWIDPDLVRGGPAYFEMVAAHDGRERLFRLVLSYLTTGDRRFAGKASALAQASLSRPWERYRMGDLVVAAWTHGLIAVREALMLADPSGYGVDTSQLSVKVAERLLAAADWLAYDLVRGGLPVRLNHDFIEASTVGLIALAYPDDPRAERWLALARDTIDRLLADHLGEDGDWYEETARYQCYLLQWFIPYAEACRRAGVEDYFRQERVRRLFTSLLFWITPNGWNLGFNDVTHEELARMAPAVFARAATEYQDGTFLWALDRVREGAPEVPFATHQVFLHLDPRRAPVAVAPMLPHAAHLRRTGIVVVRSGWEKTDNLFAIQSGPYVSHAHLDRSTIELYWRGVPLLLDAGCGPYLDRREFLMADQHNVVVVDGGYQLQTEHPYYGTEGWDFCPSFHGSVMEFLPGKALSFVKVDHSRLAQIPTATRSAVFVEPGYLILLDELVDEAEHEYASYLHGCGELTLNDVGTAHWKTPEGVDLVLNLVAPAHAAIETGAHHRAILSAADMMAGYHEHLWQRADASRPYVRAAWRGPSARFLAILVPSAPNEPGPTVRGQAENGLEIARIDGEGFSDLWISQPRSQSIDVDDVSTDGRAAFVRVRGEEPVAWLIDGGRSLRFRGRDLVRSPVPTTFLHSPTDLRTD